MNHMNLIVVLPQLDGFPGKSMKIPSKMAGDISSPTDICFGDLQNLQKGTSIPPPEWTQEGYPHFRKPRM